jgi:hypothetical protein
MTIVSSIFNNLAGHRARFLGGILCLAPLALPLLTTGCTTTVAGSGTTGSCSTNTRTCPNSGTGYTCTGNAQPNVSMACTSVDSTGDFCCYTSSASGSCNVVTTTAICASGNGISYSCTGSAQPEQGDYSLICNTNGVGDYCCITSASSCAYDPSVVGCTSGSYGYSCNIGDPPPDVADKTLVCSVPTAANGVDKYCCFTDATTVTGTCSVDRTVAGCVPDSAGNPSYGFSCTGSESPDTDFSNITCSTGTPGTDAQGNAASLFCCTYH